MHLTTTMRKISDFIDEKQPAELIEIDKIFYKDSIFILPRNTSIWLKYWHGGAGRTPDGKELEQGIIGFPNGTAVQITMPKETFVADTQILIGKQIGNAVMTPEDNHHIYTSFLRENFKWVGDFIRQSIAGAQLENGNKSN